MINSYEIEKYNDEEILYLYFDLNSEFAKINFKEKTKDIEDIIKSFIKENKIAFKGTVVALVVGSTVVGNVILNKDQKQAVTNQSDIAIIEQLNKKSTKEENYVIDEEKIEEQTEEETIITEVKKESLDEKQTYSQTNYKNDNNYVTPKTDDVIQKTDTQKLTTVLNESTSSTQATIENEEIDNNIYIKVKRTNGNIINIELEEYIIGVVGAEMPAAFHNEALKAQAIIARTYALKANSKGQILTDNESTQSYKSTDQLKSMWGTSYDTYYNKIKNAVLSTKGKYLTYNGSYIEAVYHSTSNGYTEDATNVWGNAFPYLVSVSSEYDSLNPSFIQEKTISYEELSSKLGESITIDTEFKILNKTIGNRVGSIEVNGKTYSGVSFRSLLSLRSADFDINKTDTGIVFTTRGYGHGVGLSQYGANGMAKAGSSYIDILKHYYKGVSILEL